jgi:hypothetical protein
VKLASYLLLLNKQLQTFKPVCYPLISLIMRILWNLTDPG